MNAIKLTKANSSFSKFFSAENLTKKASMNVLASGLDYGARLLVGFFVTPFVVTGLGDMFYGVWRMLGNLIGYISAASGRPSQALKWTIANLQNSSDYEEKRRNVTNAVLVWVIFLPLLAVLGGVLAWYAPHLINNLPLKSFGIVRFAAGVLVIKMIMTSLTLLPQSVLTGENLGYKRMGFSALLVFVGGGLTLTALYFETGLVGVAAAQLITSLVMGIFFLLVVRSYIPWFGVANSTWPEVRKFFGLSGWFMLWRFVNQLIAASDLVILGMFASAVQVTTYALTKYVPETLVSFASILVFGATPGLGGIIGSGDLKKAARLRGEIMILTWLVTNIIGTTILLWNQTFIQLWVGQEQYAGSTANLMILILVIQYVLIRNDANIIDLTLDISHKVLLGLLSAIVAIVLAVVMVNYYEAGIIGLVAGLIVGRFILSVAYPLMIGRFLSVSFSSQFRSALRPSLVSVVLFFLATRMEGFLSVNFLVEMSWIRLIFFVILTVISVTLVAFYLGLSHEQQIRIFRRFRQVI